MNARRILIAAALFPAVLSLLSCGNNGNSDFKRLNARAAKEYLVPVRPGVPGGQPFWNVYANKFTFAPAFDFPEVEGAAKYRFDLWLLRDIWVSNPTDTWFEPMMLNPEDRPSPAEELERFKETGTYLFSFTSDSPKADLGPVWNRIPIGYAGLAVTAVDPSGNDIAPSGSWEFLRDYPFHGPYPAAKRDYREAAALALRFNHSHRIISKIHAWNEGDTFTTEGIEMNGFYTYASKLIGSAVESEALLSTLIPSLKEECLANARKGAALLISMAPKEGRLAHLPPTYYSSDTATKGPVGEKRLDSETMTFDPIYALKGYLALYDASGEKAYLDEAMDMMRTYDALIDGNGFVPKKLIVATGEGVNDEGALSGDLLLVIQQMQRQYGVHDFDGLAARCEGWMKENALKDFNMSAQFEDVTVNQRPYRNLTNMTAGYFARYLLQKDDTTPEEMRDARDMLRFVEDQFIHWEHLPDADGLRFCSAPGVYEQYMCKVTIDASNDCYAEAALSMYEKTGDRLYLEKAKALMNTVVNEQAPGGEIPTFMYINYHPGRDFWINCSVHSVEALLRFAEIEKSK